ncbi:MAG: PEP/pyruvate-binding domain-containing protein, partial [Salegentibacter sp.]
MEVFVKKFSEITIEDVPLVGGKNASLGEMFNELASEGVQVPNGFATTSNAFRTFLKENQLDTKLKDLMSQLDRDNFENLSDLGSQARKAIEGGEFSSEFSEAILKAYAELSKTGSPEVAVRSSATA